MKDLLVWDDSRGQCCGYLNKKASKTSTFSKGKWQKRWFLIDIDIEDRGNYALQYFHSPEDTAPRQVFPLSKVNIKLAAGNSFVLSAGDEVLATLSADTHEAMKQWVDTLENVISVANLRARLLREHEDSGDETLGEEKKKRSHYSLLGGEIAGISSVSKPGRSQRSKGFDNLSPSRSAARRPVNPAVRLDVDAETIPPTSKARHQFVEMFARDVATALEITPDMVEVLSVKPAPGRDWLTLVEFDINPINLLRNQYADEEDPRYWQQLETERVDIRAKLLWTLHDLVVDPASVLYQGFVTSRLDPSFTANMVEQHAAESEEVVPYSTDPDVLAIMEHYKDIEVRLCCFVGP